MVGPMTAARCPTCNGPADASGERTKIHHASWCPSFYWPPGSRPRTPVPPKPLEARDRHDQQACACGASAAGCRTLTINAGRRCCSSCTGDHDA